MDVLQAKDLKKIYGSGNNAVHALDGVDLSVKKGEFVAIVGTSGSGKSTLLHMLGGLDRPTSGTVMVDGQDIFSLKEEALTIFRRRKIGFVFQAYNLVPVLNVYENIVLPIELDGGKVNKDFVQQIVQTLGLDDRLDAVSYTHGRTSSPDNSACLYVPNPSCLVLSRWILHSWSGAELPSAYHHPRTGECVPNRHGRSGFQKSCRCCRLSYSCRRW